MTVPVHNKGRQLDLQVSPVFLANKLSPKRIKLNEGGSGSGKTFAILQNIIVTALQQTGQVFSIVREHYRDHRDAAMRDFFRILHAYDLYDERNHRRSQPQEYYLNGNVVQFLGIDSGDKVRSARRDYLYLNEAHTLTLDKWIQLSMRTRKGIWIDYNPSFTEHEWLDAVIARDDCEFIHSTYLDNYDFLEPDEIAEIERLINISEYHDKVYRQGLRAVLKGQIFKYTLIDEMPAETKGRYTGLDFGFTNDPTACMDVLRIGDNLYIDELFYRRGLTNPAISEELKAVGHNRQRQIVADSAEPKSVTELQEMGWNVEGAIKGPDSVRFGLNTLLKFKIFITKRSTNFRKEADNYIWSTHKATGELTNEPIDAYNHGWDAVRYVAGNKFVDSGKRKMRMGF